MTKNMNSTSIPTSSKRTRQTTISSSEAGSEFAGSPPEQIRLVFDGYCGFCARMIRWIRRIDRHDRITALAGQANGTFEVTGVTADESREAVWAVTPDGRRTAGAAAIALALTTALGSRIPLIPFRLPAIARRLDRIYTWVADNRRRFRGDQPWCEAKGDGICEPDR